MLNRKRSATACRIYESGIRFEVKSTGTNKMANSVLSDETLNWANAMVVMGKYNRNYKQKHFPLVVKKRELFIFTPDIYGYMDAELIEILKVKIEVIDIRNFN